LDAINLLVPYDVADCGNIRGFNAGGEDFVSDPLLALLKLHQETSAFDAVMGFGIDFMREIPIGHCGLAFRCARRPRQARQFPWLEKRDLMRSVPAFKERQQPHTILKEIVPQIASGLNGEPIHSLGRCGADALEFADQETKLVPFLG
jgi:hypothetical protein